MLFKSGCQSVAKKSEKSDLVQLALTVEDAILFFNQEGCRENIALKTSLAGTDDKLKEGVEKQTE